MIQEKRPYKCPVFTPEIKEWIIANTNKMSGKDAWELFHKTFPDVKTTSNSLSWVRTTLGLGKTRRIIGSPLYSERMRKDGYLFVKVQMSPAKYISKAKWVYMATHPWDIADISEKDHFMFADGNKYNFDWKNILWVKTREALIFNFYGGIVKGKPEETRINLARAKLRVAMFDAGEKAGLTTVHNGSRVFKYEVNEKRKAYLKKLKSTEEGRQKYKELTKKQHQRQWERKTEEEKEAYRAHRRVYMKEWNKKNKEKRNKKNKKWLESNKEKKSEYNRRYREKKKAEVSEINQQ